MYSKIKFFGHPVHPMLVSFPITLYTLSFVCFILYAWKANPFWFQAGYYCNGAGIIAALLAAVPGFLDWWVGIPKNTAARKRGRIHGWLNVSALVAFVVNFLLVKNNLPFPPQDMAWPIILSGIGVILTTAAGYHGFTLIGTHKVGVDLTPEQERIEQAREAQPPRAA